MMKKIWLRIDAWLAENAQKTLNALNPGGTSSELEKLEKDLGVTFPQDFRASYYIHDGQRMGWPPLIGDWYLLSIDEIKHQRSVMKNLWDAGDFEGATVLPDPQVKQEWWKPEWIPITYNGAGDLHCLDFDPTSQGVYGQVILFEHANEQRKCVAPSFEIFLQQFVDDIESGKYEVDEDGWLEEK